MKRGKKEITDDKKANLKNGNNIPQKKYLLGQKQLRVWMDSDKFEVLKKLTAERGTSIHRIINNFVDAYISSGGDIKI